MDDESCTSPEVDEMTDMRQRFIELLKNQLHLRERRDCLMVGPRKESW